MIYICSPYRGDTEGNEERACKYCRLAMKSGGIPFAPHLLFTRFLKDDDPDERCMGLRMGIEMLKRCKEMWVFGLPTEGMREEGWHESWV